MRSDFIIPNLQLREQFRDEQSIIRNGWTVTGSPTINDGVSGFTPTDYLEVNHVFNVNLSIFLRLTVANDGGNYSRVLDSANNNIRILWEGINKYFYMIADVGVASRNSRTNSFDLTAYEGQTITMGFTISYDGTNTNIRDYFNGVAGGTNGPYAGHIVLQDNPLRLGSRVGGVASYQGTIYDFMIFDEVLEEEDFLQLHNGTLTSDIQPEKSRIILPGNRQWNNGSGDRVTPALGTVKSEVELGNGTTSTTFPTLEDGRVFSFDGGDYINCGHDNNFNFTINQPFTVGCMLYFGTGSSSNTIIGKRITTYTSGEFAIYVISTRRPLFVLLDTDNAGYRYWFGSNGDIINNSWQSFICCYDGSGGLAFENARIYVNGVDKTITTGTDGTTFVNMRGGSANLTIGSLSNGTARLQAGNKVSLPFIFPTCLSPLQVKIMHEKMKLWRQIP